MIDDLRHYHPRPTLRERVVNALLFALAWLIVIAIALAVLSLERIS